MARVLVIEDDQVLRDLVFTYLTRLGYDVVTASDGPDGLAAFRSCPDLIDVVITDVRMPGMSGNDTVRLIWQTKPNAKVICMTGSAEDVRLKGIPVLTKPFSMKELSRWISHLIAAA
jgi:CheY-like chemotaxis protein